MFSTCRLICIIAPLVAAAVAGGTERYSCQADVFMFESYEKKPVVWSPDHSKHIRLWGSKEHSNLSIYSTEQLLKTISLWELSGATFVKWAPDSKAFYVMWSDGGAIGGYHIRAFLVSDDQATESPAPKKVAVEFAQHHYCSTRGNNLYAIRWEDGSNQLLLKAGVYPTSDCGRQMGFAAGYRVNTVSGEITQQYSAKQVDDIANNCPSVVFPSAFASQEDVDATIKNGKIQK